METNPIDVLTSPLAKLVGFGAPLAIQLYQVKETPELLSQAMGRTMAYAHGVTTGAATLNPELPEIALRSFIGSQTNLGLPTYTDTALGAATGGVALVDLLRNKTSYPLIGHEGLLPRLADAFRVAAAASAPHAIHSLLRLAEYAPLIPDALNTTMAIEIGLSTGIAAVGLLQLGQSGFRQLLRPTGDLIKQAVTSVWENYQEQRAQDRAARRQARRSGIQSHPPVDPVQHTTALAARNRTELGLIPPSTTPPKPN